MRLYVLMVVDSDEASPMGAYPTLAAARMRALVSDLEGCESAEQHSRIVLRFDASWAAYVNRPLEELEGTEVDVTWAAVDMDWDYRIFSVKVFATSSDT